MDIAIYLGAFSFAVLSGRIALIGARGGTLKLAMTLGLLPVLAGCGASYDIADVSGGGSVKDCDLAPIVYRALEQPPVLKLDSFDDALMFSTWSTEPRDVEVVVNWLELIQKGTPEEDERWMKDFIYNARDQYRGIVDDKRRIEREILEEFPWTVLVKVEKIHEGRRVDDYWSGILLHPYCVLFIKTSTDVVIRTPTTWPEFREKVEQVRSELAASAE